MACPLEPDEEPNPPPSPPPSTPYYTITFNTHGGSEVAAITEHAGATVEQPADPTKEGFAFLGWFSAETGGTPYEWPYTLTSHVTMHAQWRDNSIPRQVTLTFDAHGGSPVEAITGNEGETVEQPPEPAREGFAFQGWFSAETDGTRYVWPQTLSVSVTMHARWRDNTLPPPAQYILSFDAHGGSETASITGSEDDPVMKPADPTREGYAFTGWFSAESGGIRYAWPHTLKADLTMHAQWWDDSRLPPARYTITLNTHGGSTVDTIAGYEGEKVAQPPDPSRTGYGFTGWYDEESGGTRYAWPHTLTGNLTMHAQWWDSSKPPPARYTITFDSRGGSAMEAIAGNEGESLARPANPTKTGYTFEGWYSVASGGTRYEWPYTLSSDVTMYAHWNTADYTITYNLKGGTNASGNPTSYNIDSNDITLAAPARTGYDFGDWHDNEACEGTAVTQIPKGSTGNKTFWATWTLKTYTITYELDGGTNVEANPGTYTIESEAITLAAPTRTGYSFDGWRDKQSSGNRVETIPKGSAGNRTLWAQWHVGDYTITYNLNGGGNAYNNNPTSYNIATGDITLAAPDRPSYNFGGWYDNEACEGDAVAKIPQGSMGDKTFWAKWTPTIYTITYELNGWTNAETNPGTYTIESDDITLAAPTRTGYSFSHWSESSSIYSYKIPKGSTGNKTFIVAPSTLVNYTITYNLKDGTNAYNNPTSYNIESNNITLDAPTRTGYDFGGWYDNEACEGTAVTQIPKGSTGNKTFWTTWTLKTYTITYELDGGTNVEANPGTYTIESEAITLAAPTRTGYSFDGWRDKQSSGNRVETIPKGSAGNRTFTASWTLVNYTITYNLNGGTNASGNPTSYNIESNNITLAAPTRTGYIGSWHDTEACEGTAVTAIPKGSWGNKTFWVKWTPVYYTITYNNLYDGTNAATNPAIYTIESDAITLAVPIRTDCSFDGWYDESYGTKVDTIPKGSTGNKIFWATWTVNSFAKPLVLSIKVIDQADGAVTENVFELARPGGKKTITVAETDAGQDFVWHIGLLQYGTGRSIELSADTLTPGIHTLQVTAKYEGTLYSKEIKFTVK